MSDGPGSEAHPRAGTPPGDAPDRAPAATQPLSSDALAATIPGVPTPAPTPAAAPASATPLVGQHRTPRGAAPSPGCAPAEALEAAAALPAGHRLGHFEIVRLLGKGGMGAVYLARDLSLERDVALKVVAAGLLAPDDELLERFVREARAQARLSHPNVVQIYFIGVHGDLRFFAMEHVDGGTVEELLQRRGALPWDEALELLLGVARALQAAHARGLIHRDLKPSNLLLPRGGAPGEIKVADFGLAKWVNQPAGSSTLTAQGVILGTPQYIAPEQGLGEPTDHRADIYALGATAYHLLAGEPPFQASTPMALVAKHITAPPPPLRTCRKGYVPPGLALCIERMLAKKPAERYQSYDELIAALEGARAAALAPAGFWVRGVATLVDVTFMGVLCWAVNLYMLALYPVYYVALHRLHGRSLGKRLLGLRVHTIDGRLPSTPRLMLRAVVAITGLTLALGVAIQRRELSRPAAEAFFRLERDAFDAAARTNVSPAWDTNLRLQIYRAAWDQRRVLVHAYWPSAAFALLTLGGLLVAAFDRQRRALHDIVAGTLVTHERPAARPRAGPRGA